MSPEDTAPDQQLGLFMKGEGQERVLRNAGSWSAGARSLIELLCQRFPSGFTSNELREAATFHGIGEPKHPNAWGAAFSSAARAGLIRKTNDFVRSKQASRRAGEVRVWEPA